MLELLCLALKKVIVPDACLKIIQFYLIDDCNADQSTLIFAAFAFTGA